MWMVKLATGCTWVEAAATLGLPTDKVVGMANRVMSLLRKTGSEELFAERMLDVASRFVTARLS
jgi:Na+-translocating ferredoxin:NAD+ oxidoreductase RnfE subunit